MHVILRLNERCTPQDHDFTWEFWNYPWCFVYNQLRTNIVKFHNTMFTKPNTIIIFYLHPENKAESVDDWSSGRMNGHNKCAEEEDEGERESVTSAWLNSGVSVLALGSRAT